jgi:hypothetical protein
MSIGSWNQRQVEANKEKAPAVRAGLGWVCVGHGVIRDDPMLMEPTAIVA